MDPSELRMNLASLQRIDPYIVGILMSSPQVALYKYAGTEWEKTNIEGTLFVYERKCEPCFGFLILNRLSSTNLIQPITKDIELQDKTPFLLYRTKDINGIWFYEQTNCKKLFQIINQVINKVKSGSNEVLSFASAAKGAGNVAVKPTAKNGEISLADLLTNAGNKEKNHQPPTTQPAKPNNVQTSPSGGEKLLRLLSISESRQPEPEQAKMNGGGGSGDSVAAFFAQVSQGNSGPPPPALPVMTQNPLLNSLFTEKAVSGSGMPPLPAAAMAASEIESDLKPGKMGKKTASTPGVKKEPPKKKIVAQKTPDKSNGTYASVVASVTTAAASAPVDSKPAPALQGNGPQLMSPMVFAGQNNSPLPVSAATMHVTMPIIPNMTMIPMPAPQLTPLTESQLLQAFQHLLRTDRTFISKLHQAYVESLNVQLQ